MENTTKKSSVSRKILVFGILALLLIGFPLGSYFYSKSGYNSRVKAQSELKDYGKIRGAYIIWPDGTKEDQLKGKVCVIHFLGENPDLTPANKQVLDDGEELYQQFGYKGSSIRNDFRFVLVGEGGTSEFKSHMQTRPSIDFSNWVWTGGLGSWTTILKNGYDYYCTSENITPYPEYYALTDTSGVIRRFYNVEDRSEVNRMVHQIALLLPKE
jgi:hypothetical protein